MKFIKISFFLVFFSFFYAIASELYLQFFFDIFSSNFLEENLFFEKNDWLFQQQKFANYLLTISSQEIENECIYFNLNKEEQIELISLLWILITNFANINDLNLLLLEINKFEKIFNFSFIKLSWFSKLTNDFISYKLFSADSLQYYKHLTKFVISYKEFQIKWSLNEAEINNIIDFLTIQIFFIEIASVFFKKKILIFFLINFLFITLMFWNLIWLATSINLIFALLHFLFFAILSSLLIIFWGSIYIGLCTILIYGAAIPVLALYIIMLVNVDLIQWLFFIEYINSSTIFDKIKRISIFIVLFIFIVLSFNNLNLLSNLPSTTILEELHLNIFYLLLAKRFLATTVFLSNNTSAYDLYLTFYSSDIDKVASAAFKSSYNELLALVFLLLIAIIVVISISWPSTKIDKHFYQTLNFTDKELNNILMSHSKYNSNRFKILLMIEKFLKNWMIFSALYSNSNFAYTHAHIHLLKLNLSKCKLIQNFIPIWQLPNWNFFQNNSEYWFSNYFNYWTEEFKKQMFKDSTIIWYSVFEPITLNNEDNFLEILYDGYID